MLIKCFFMMTEVMAGEIVNPVLTQEIYIALQKDFFF